eukprot:CRZ04786.1 hypothetical protein [Spongospora subterranea]
MFTINKANSIRRWKRKQVLQGIFSERHLLSILTGSFLHLIDQIVVGSVDGVTFLTAGIEEFPGHSRGSLQLAIMAPDSAQLCLQTGARGLEMLVLGEQFVDLSDLIDQLTLQRIQIVVHRGPKTNAGSVRDTNIRALSEGEPRCSCSTISNNNNDILTALNTCHFPV